MTEETCIAAKTLEIKSAIVGNWGKIDLHGIIPDGLWFCKFSKNIAKMHYFLWILRKNVF